MSVLRIRAVLAIALAIAAGPAAGQGYPAKPVRIVIPYGAGSADAVGRLVALRLGERLGQSFVVESRGGGDGIVGAETVAKAAPDGYTLLFSTSGTMAILPQRRSTLPYDPFKSFVHVAQAISLQFAFIAGPSLPAKTLGELVTLARAKPDGLTYASSSETGFITTELFKLATGTKIVHVPYKGGGQATTDLLSGQVDLSVIAFAPVMPYLKSGQLRVLAVTGRTRSPSLPDVPTAIEAGVKDYESSSAWGISAPAGTPREVVARLNGAMQEVLRLPDVGEKMLALGVEPRPGTPEQYTEVLQSENRKYAALLPRIGMKRD